MVIKKGKRIRVGDETLNIVNVVVMAILAVLFLYPFWYTLMTSFCNVAESNETGIRLIVKAPTLESYKMVLTSKNLLLAYGNTVFRTVAGSLLSLIVTFCAAVALARKDLPGRGFIQTVMIITMFFGGGLIPTYLLVNSLGMLNSYWALLIPGLTSCWHILITRNFIYSIPRSFEESALIDGANPITITFRIIFPLSMPIIAVLLLWFGVGHWNSYFDAMIYNRQAKFVVLQQLLRRILIDSNTDEFMKNSLNLSTALTTPQTVKAATIIVSIVPIVCVYPFLQKYFVKGILLGGLKD